MNIENAKIIVTGGSLGIGKETARMLVEKGAKVLITGRNQQRLDQAALETGAIPFLFDISEVENIPQNAQKCLELLGGVDALVNNAGIGVFPKLGEVSMADFEKVFTTNVFGLALLTQELLPAFKDQNYGHIINVGSTASLKGFPGGTVYAASKFALRGMSLSWQAELRKNNVRVTHLNPSEVLTAFANPDRTEREAVDNKLSATEIAHTMLAVLELDDRGFIPEVSVWATNPF